MGRKLNAYKTLRRCPGLLLNSLCTFNLRTLSKGYTINQRETNHTAKPPQSKLKTCNKLYDNLLKNCKKYTAN